MAYWFQSSRVSEAAMSW